jgi:hypothetical protein
MKVKCGKYVFEIVPRREGTNSQRNFIYLDDVVLGCDGSMGLNTPSLTLEEALEKAKKRADDLGVVVTPGL